MADQRRRPPSDAAAQIPIMEQLARVMEVGRTYLAGPAGKAEASTSSKGGGWSAARKTATPQGSERGKGRK